MVKLIYLFVMVLCLAQNFQKTLAESEENKENENVILKIMKFLLADEFERFADEHIKLYYEAEVEQNIEINNIFKSAKEDIADLYDDSSLVEECSLMAYEELDALNETTKTNVANCIAKGTNRTSEIVNKTMQNLMKEVSPVIIDLKVKVTKCFQKFEEYDMISLLPICLDMKDILKMMKTMEEATINNDAVAELILQRVAEVVGTCLQKVKVDTLMNTEHVVNELKYCIKKV